MLYIPLINKNWRRLVPQLGSWPVFLDTKPPLSCLEFTIRISQMIVVET